MPLVELIDLAEAWPATSVVFPEPFVFHPSADDLAVIALDPNSAGRPLVLPPVLVNDIPGGGIWPSGEVEAADGRVVLESAKRPGHLLNRVTERRLAPAQRPEHRIDGVATTIAAPGRGLNYFHWVIDMLPRLFALEHTGEPATVVCSERVPSFVRELFERVAPDHLKVRFFPPQAIVRADVVRFPGFTTAWGHGLLRPEIARWLRARLLGREPTRPEPGRRLYIRRVGTRWNVIRNEAEVIRALAAFDVEAVQPDLLSVSEQVELFADAELIVGPHGAGLTNAAVADRAAVVDIHPNGLEGTRAQITYWSLARTFGHRYVAVLNDTPRKLPEFEAHVGSVCEAVEIALDGTPTCAVVGR